jgi:hypothetical protein
VPTAPTAPASLEVVATAPAVAASLTPAAVAEAQRYREDFGLRSDESWVRRVAADPASVAGVNRYGIPLTPEEVGELERRIQTTEAIKRLVVPYGESHPEDWAGAWIDHEASGRLIAQFSGHVEEHRRQLYARISPEANFEVRAVDRSLAEIREMASVLDEPANQEWFATIPAVLKGYGLRVAGNRLGVDLSTVHPDAPRLVAEHFGWGDAVQVDVDGTGALLLGRGVLTVTARDGQGRPVAGLGCTAVADLPGAYESPQQVPRTGPDGQCTLELPATGYWIRLSTQDDLAGMARATVVPNGRATVTVLVEGD